jgi:hypothetical protein
MEDWDKQVALLNTMLRYIRERKWKLSGAVDYNDQDAVELDLCPAQKSIKLHFKSLHCKNTIITPPSNKSKIIDPDSEEESDEDEDMDQMEDCESQLNTPFNVYQKNCVEVN